jgi:hypothetical protein
MKAFMRTIPTSLIIRTSTIALAKGVRGLAPAVRRAVNDDNIGRNGLPSVRGRGLSFG